MSLGSFTPDNLIHLSERERSFEQLEKLGNVWIGPDVAIEKSVVVQPGQLLLQGVNIILNKKDLPMIEITRGAMGSLNWSTRSFLAQSGIEILFHESSLSDNMLKNINDGKNVSVPLDVINYGQRAVELDGKIMRFFWVNDSKRLRGADLVNTIKSGEFTVEGVEGEDWFLGGSKEDEKIITTGADSNKGLCVVLRLKPQKFYIPYAPEPIKKNDSKNTRDDLSTVQKPIPDGVELNFEIGETPKIKLGLNIIAVINTGAEKGQKHINSPLIDSGSDWPIRTETLHGLKYIDFFLYRK